MATLIQWNINSLKEQHAFLEKLINSEKADIICLQEKNLKQNQTTK